MYVYKSVSMFLGMYVCFMYLCMCMYDRYLHTYVYTLCVYVLIFSIQVILVGIYNMFLCICLSIHNHILHVCVFMFTIIF